MKRKLFYAVAVIAAALVLLVACAPEAPPAAPPTPVAPAAPTAPAKPAPAPPKPPAVRELLLGSTSTASGWFPYQVTMTRLINENVPGVHVTIVEGGATYDNLERMLKGYLDMGSCCSPEGVIKYYHGQEGFGPFPELRVVNIHMTAPNYINVRADSGVKSLRDLDGKKFHAGTPGSGPERNIKIIMEALGIKPDYFVGGLRDALEALKDRRIVGISYAGTAINFNAAMLEVHALNPLHIVPFTKEELETVMKVTQGQAWITIPAGTFKSLPHLPTFSTYGYSTGTVATTDIPPDQMYAIAKAVREHWDEIAAVAPPGGHELVDVLELGISIYSHFDKPVPLHAGVVRYAKEEGFEVPEKLIPPEYKE